MNIVILMPVLDDWISAAEVLDRIDGVFSASEDAVEILIVDDGSSEAVPANFAQGPYRKIGAVSVLMLKKNMGHQRALAIGLCHLARAISCNVVLVMDSDGEDEASDAKRLVERFKINARPAVVFAERRNRSESLVFRIFYLIYRLLHIVLTGQGIRFGNFSAIPAQLLPALTIEPMLWNHMAASIVRSRFSIDLVPTNRGKRIDGKSHLNFSALVIHGLSALACYNERIGVRLLLFMGLPIGAAFLGVSIIIGMAACSTVAIPGWAWILCILIGLLLLQIVTLIVDFVLQTIAARSIQPFIPARDYELFVQGTASLYPQRSS